MSARPRSPPFAALWPAIECSSQKSSPGWPWLVFQDEPTVDQFDVGRCRDLEPLERTERWMLNPRLTGSFHQSDKFFHFACSEISDMQWVLHSQTAKMFSIFGPTAESTCGLRTGLPTQDLRILVFSSSAGAETLGLFAGAGLERLGWGMQLKGFPKKFKSAPDWRRDGSRGANAWATTIGTTTRS